MSVEDIPIACTLLPDQYQERRALLEPARQAVQEVRECERGYAYRFPADRLEGLAHIVDLERQCCPFIRFTLTVEPGNGPLWLEISGPSGTKDFMSSFLQ